MNNFLKCVLVIVVVIPFCVSAETIYLNDGSTLKGTIKSIKEAEIIVSTDFGDISVPNTQISRIDYSKAKSSEQTQTSIESVHAARTLEKKDVPLNEKPGYWFVLSGISLAAAIYSSSIADGIDADNAAFKTTHPSYTYEPTGRGLIYLQYGMAAIAAIVGINKMQVNETTSIVVSTSGNSTFMVATHQF